MTTSFRINRVYTRSGDNGTTSLVGGQRVQKTDARVAAYGDVDELNSQLGVVKQSLGPRTKPLSALIEYLQQELFDLGSELATPCGEKYEGMWRAEASHVEALEKLCDAYGKDLPELQSFILPGGSALAAELHVARTVARRAERQIVAVSLGEGERANPYVVQYVNRLSDLFFVLARWALAAEGAEAPLWKPVRERSLPLPK